MLRESVEIAAVVVYRVVDAAKAIFDVDDYLEFVEIQSETALRHVAAKYPYDNFNEKDGISYAAAEKSLPKSCKPNWRNGFWWLV